LFIAGLISKTIIGQCVLLDELIGPCAINEKCNRLSKTVAIDIVIFIGIVLNFKS